MTIKLKNLTTNVEVTLNPDMEWQDENSWSPIEQTSERTITGAMILQVGTRVGCRPITLAPPDSSAAWMTFSQVELLRNFAAVPALQMKLTLRGVERTVVFRHQDGGFEAAPVVFYRDNDGSDFYLCTLRLLEL